MVVNAYWKTKDIWQSVPSKGNSTKNGWGMKTQWQKVMWWVYMCYETV